MDLQAEKKRIRAEIKQRVAELPADYIERSNQEIFRRVTALEVYKAAKTIFCFIGRDIEIDTMPIINHALESGKVVGVPRITGKRIMEVRRFEGLDRLELNRGILEPDSTSAMITPEEIDFAILPCVTCNKKGHRLGYGGGFYDTYLQGAKFPNCVICRSRLMYEDIPMMVHDIVPDVVVSDEDTKIRHALTEA